MNRIIQRLSQALSLRVFLNIILWIIVAFELYFSNYTDVNAAMVYTARGVSFVSLVAFSYFNNLFLIPRFLAKNHKWMFVVLAFLLILGYSFGYSLFIQGFVKKHPDIHLYQIVLFSVAGKAEWSVANILKSTLEYSFVYGIWLFVFTTAWYMHDHARQRKVMLQTQQQQVETELNFLKSQINPHFLFNTLNNLYALALRKSDQSPEAILKLSAILRYLLYDSNTPTVPFQREQEIMEAYIEIERLRMEDPDELSVHISCDEQKMIPPLLWLPVLENVFKHGMRTIGTTGKADFRFELNSNRLLIYSRNKEKQGLSGIEANTGIGLSNLRKRLDLLYPGKHQIEIRRENNEYITEVTIDLA